LEKKIRNGKESAILSKKLAKIITDVPVQFHEEDFRLKDWNKTELIEVFTELEFKTLGKRVLGEEFNAFQSVPVGVQTDLFGNAVVTTAVQVKTTVVVKESTNGEEEVALGLKADKNISNTLHDYKVVDTEEGINELIKELLPLKEICFDTETTGHRSKQC
jgi:DNA polymerase-1